ncbi:MAG: hypothetical protein KGO48_08820 [Alphaproteobacteria bacterium]|nr:hypothetical protein [Alphaproteobacteria bacterium]
MVSRKRRAQGHRNGANLLAFVCGSSGSGKTTTIRNAGIDALGADVLRASEILIRIGRPINDLSSEDIDKNQDLLFDWLANHTRAESRYVIDAHLIIRSKTREGIPVSEALLRTVPLGGFIMIRDRPHALLKRTQSKVSDISVDELQSLVDQEEQYAKRLAQSLHVQFRNVRAFDSARLRTVLRRMFAGKY